MSWDPGQYLKFSDLRLRPALDLLARVPQAQPRLVFDLGCGAGNVAAKLALRWPKARITGVDSSPAMLAEAKTRLPACEWIEGDLASWLPDEGADVIFSNAAYQWIKGHERLFPRLFQRLGPGGCLAVQMPRNFAAPSHRAIFETAAEGPWKDRLAACLDPFEVLEPEAYHDLLRPLGATLDIWETDYLQLLTGQNPVLEWVKGTTLRPFLAALEGAAELKTAFLETVGRRLCAAYPARADGVTLLPFRRLFLVAARAKD
jgi:trans-aconitate 2-methyltransferase